MKIVNQNSDTQILTRFVLENNSLLTGTELRI